MTAPGRQRGGLTLVHTTPRAVDGLPPPHDLAAERSCLGIAMVSRSARDAVCEATTIEDFFAPAHQVLREGLGELATLQQPAELELLGGWLRDRQKIQKVGGIEYLQRCAAEESAAPENARGVAWRVRGFAAIRRWIASTQASAAIGYSPTEVQKHASPTDPTGAHAWITSQLEALAHVAPDSPEDLDAFHIGAGAAEESAAACSAAQRASIDGPFVDTGVREIDDVTNIGPSEVLIIGATKGLGKTTLVRSIAHRIAKTPQKLPDGRADCERCGSEAPCCEAHGRQPRGVLVLALEGKRQDWADAITARACGLNLFDRAKGRWSNDDHATFLKELAELKKLPIVVDDRKNLCKRNLGPRVRAWREWFARKGARLDMIALDYFQIAAWERTGGTREEDLSEAGRQIITLATDPESDLLGIAWVVIVALNKDGGARESGAIEYHADAFWRIAKAKAKGGTDAARALRLWVEKQRRGPSGVGASFWFDPTAGHFWS